MRIHSTVRFVVAATLAATVVGPAVPVMALDAQGGPAGAHAGAALSVSGRAAVSASEHRIIGYSVLGRPITAVRYGPADAQRVGVFIGEIHGTERAGIPIVKRLARLGPPTGAAMWIIKTVNPDGHAARTRKNANGVDLNRNTSHLWKGTARAPDYYPGRSAISEPETRSYMEFLDAVDPDVVLIYHQAGGGVDTYKPKDPVLVRELARRMRMPAKPFNCDGECTGTLTGWFNNRSSRLGAAITVELWATTTSAQVRRWARAARWSISAAAQR